MERVRQWAPSPHLSQWSGTLAGHYQDIFTVGFPHVRAEIADKLRQEQGHLIPLAIGALLIALFILLRQLVDILTPILTAGISIL